MTEKLYYDDPFLFEFNATVTEVTENGVVLDRTAFFPEGGGQAGDRGTINGIEVSDTKTVDGKIVHFITSPLPLGAEVLCEVDAKERFRKMQHHTGEHIVSGLAWREYGLTNVGFHLGDEDMTKSRRRKSCCGLNAWQTKRWQKTSPWRRTFRRPKSWQT